ncbi:MAG: condensation domain-containing protein, partial [Clostridium sp.]
MSADKIDFSVEDVYGLTPMQEGMLFHKLLDEDKSNYFIQQVMKIKGSLNHENVKEAIELLMAKYSVFRTAIVYNSSNKPFQVVFSERNSDFQFFDFSNEENVESKVNELLKEDIKRGFDFEKDTLMRVKLIKVLNNEYKMVWSFHHIIIDGWCLSLIIGDFFDYYNRLNNDETKEELLEEIEYEKEDATSYGDYIRYLEDNDKDEALDYFENLLSEYDEIAEITPTQTKSFTDEEVRMKKINLTYEVTQSIKALSSKYSITINTIFESAWGILLQKYNNKNDVVFGKVVSGRDIDMPGIEKTVGLFINTIPVRVKNNNYASCKDIIIDVQEQALDSINFDYCPLVEIQNRVQSSSDFIKTLFVFENYFVDEDKIEAGLKDCDIEVERYREQTNYPITVTVVNNDETIEIGVMYDPKLYSEYDISQL